MATEWPHVIEILSAISHTAPHDVVPDLYKFINNRSSDILNHGDEYEEFFSLLVALSSHFIGLNISSSTDYLHHATGACQVILKFCLARITKERDKFFSKKHLVSVIEGLCKGHGCLERSEVTTFLENIRQAKHPKNESTSKVSEDEKKTEFYGKLTRQGLLNTTQSFPRLPFARHRMFGFEDDDMIDAKTYLSNANVSTLREMHGGQILLDLCISLPNISEFMTLHGLIGNKPSMKTIDNLSLENLIHFNTDRMQDIVTEMNLICSIVSIPVMEPLNSYRLNKIMLLTLGCVDIAMYASSGYLTSSAVEDIDDLSRHLVDTSLAIVDVVSHTLSTSHRAGGHIVQNFNLLITHCILKGLGSLLSNRGANEDKVSETRWEGLNILRMELSRKVIGILSSLLEDLRLERSDDESGVDITAEEMNIEVNVSAWYRVKLLFDHLQFVPLLTRIFILSYYKADYLSEAVQTSSKGGDDSKSTNNDVETKSNNSNEDSSEGETLFGVLFDAGGNGPDSSTTENGQKSWKNEIKMAVATSYLETSKTILVFIMDYMLNNVSPNLMSKIQETLPDTHLTDLASLVLELDEAKTHIGNLSSCYSFNQCLDRYIHILLIYRVLSDQQQEAILKKLGIWPHASGDWPLYIAPRSLAILARVLLGRQESCRESGNEQDDESCVKIWQRLIQTLKEMAFNERRKPGDLNVEQLQLLLLVWHNFTHKQQDDILVSCVNALCAISKDRDLSDKVPLYCMRLLTILDYMVYQYNKPPRELLTQVQYNLFKTKLSYMGMPHMDDDMMDEPRLIFFPTVEREDRDYHKPTGDPVGHTYEKRTPRFYGVRCGDQSKLSDEMLNHLSLILAKENSSYSQFYNSLITLLSAGSNCDVLRRQKSKFVNLSDAKIVRCLFGLCWRLLVSSLPPVWFLLDLQDKQPVQLKKPSDFMTVLLTVYWSTKLSNTEALSTIMNNLKGQKIPPEEAKKTTDGILTAVCDEVLTISHACSYLQQIYDKYTHKSEVLESDLLPGLLTVITVDCVLARVSVVLKSKSPPALELQVEIQKLFAVLLKLVKVYQGFARFSLLSHHNVSSKVRDQDIPMYSNVIKISSSAMAKNPTFVGPVIAGLPVPQEDIKQWNNLGSVDFSPMFSPEDIIHESLSDEIIYSLLSAHMKVMSFRFPFNLDASIRHVMKSLLQLLSSLLIKYQKEEEWLHCLIKDEISDAIIPLLVDSSAEYLFEENILESILGSLDNEEVSNQIQNYLLDNCYNIMIENSLSQEQVLSEDIFVDCLRFMEGLLERPQSRNLLKNFFEDNDKFVRLLFLSANQNFSLSFVYRMLKFASRTVETYEKQPSDSTALALVQSLSKISEVDPSLLTSWLHRIIVGSLTDKEMTGKMADNRLLLQSIVTFLVKEQSPVSSVAIETFLDSIIPIGTLLLDMAIDVSVVIGSRFVDFLSVSSSLAGYGDGSGHLKLMKAVVIWLQTCKSDMNPNLIGDSKSKDSANSLVECTNVLLAHVADVLVVLKQTDDDDMGSGCHGDDHVVSDIESDGVDDEDDSGAEESEEDVEGNQLWNKLCTFTTTRKEFANQHWYHCHTCRMNDGVGVCTICAKVCHRNHDVTYAKYGSFFCDCGAKEDDSCKAMKKRNPYEISDMASPDEKISSVNSYRRSQQFRTEPARSSVSTENKSDEVDKNKEKSSYEFGQPTFRKDLRKQIEPNKKALIKVITDNDMSLTLLNLLNILSRVSSQDNQVEGGARQRMIEALQELHSCEKHFQNNEQLLVPTSGSQEGAFENVKLVCSGEQGQTIRQLIGSHVLRRVAMCCLTSIKGRRQHLAVNHEKGKITILQLSSLLKQADASRRKLTITRLATTQVPFTILSLTGNLCNEDFLAVSGLKDCHVLTLSSSGSVVNQLVLHPQLETGNFIIKTIWLPGSQTELALVTADFVQIYDLSKDALSPVFYFVLPAGKIRDVSFIFQSSVRHMCLMSSEGQIYLQQLDESSSAKSGPFYLTNIVPVIHPELTDNNGQVAGGGVSVYYSHRLQMLFFSYVQGKTFVAPWPENLSQITNLFPIDVRPSNGNKAVPATLCQWSEVLQHPGLVLCLTHTTGLPIMLMLESHNISYQEIKTASSKSKIQDVVAIRHSLCNSDQSRTTVILLCDDGSLKIFMANQEHTLFWISPYFQPTSAVVALKPIKTRKSKKNVRIKTTSSPQFPIDFFEHCQVLNDVEFGGKDILQVYNVQQVKHRLMTAGMYIACTKSNSFSMTVTNCNPSMVIVGVRVLVGCQTIDKAPTYVEVFGRVIDVEIKRNRWFDIPFAREEVLSTDRTVTLTFGQSHDSSSVTMIDSIKVYCKSKEVFGWPDDLQDEGVLPPTPTPAAVPPVSPFTQNPKILPNTTPLSLREIMTANSLRALDGFVSLVSADEENSYEDIVTIATSLLSSPLPQQVQEQAKILLASLHPTKMTYNNHKDHAQLSYVVNSLYETNSSTEDEVDPEIFERLVVMARAVAVNRPENLVKFTNELTESLHPEGGSVPFLSQIILTFWRFYRTQPGNSPLATVLNAGMQYIEMIIFALVEILHAFIVTDSIYVPVATELYVQLLLCEDTRVSFACKQALAFVLRPSSRRPSTNTEKNTDNKPEAERKTDDQTDGTRKPVESQPEVANQNPEVGEESAEGVAGGEGVAVGEGVAGVGQQSGEGAERRQNLRFDDDDIMNITPPWEDHPEEDVPVPDLPEPGPSSGGRETASSAGNRLEELLNAGFPADDEAMMELAIALSLQEQGEETTLGLQHFLGEAIENGGPVDEGEASSSSASGHASEDDEPRTGSMDLVQIQVETTAQQSSQDLGSVSEGSAESLTGENPGDEQDRQEDAMESESGVGATPKPDDQTDVFNMSKYDADVREKFHNLNLVILRAFIEHFPKLNGISGVQAIPFMQVLLMLCFDLDNDKSDNTDLLHQVFTKCVEELHLDSADITDIACRSSSREVQLIIMRFLSVLMSRSKSGGKSSCQQTSSMSTQVATSLFRNHIMDHCLAILNRLMEHWQARDKTKENEENVVTLLKQQPVHSPPDMSPFFLKQYVKSHANDIFEAYPLLVTEMVLRLMYQVKKIVDGSSDVEMKDLPEEWFTCLFEYMMIQQSSFVKIKRQVRKLLLFLCGSKENYREQRDSHSLNVHFKTVGRICHDSGFSEEEKSPIDIEYETLLNLIEHLKAAADIASNRTKNWQAYCLKNQHTLSFLFKVSFIINEGVATTILQLLTTALCDNDRLKNSDKKDPGNVYLLLVQQLTQSVDIDTVRQFVRCFLLQSNSTSIRWQAHSLLYCIHRNSEVSQQDKISDMIWSVWPELPAFGRKAEQFVDLLGYFTIKRSVSEEKAAEFSEKAIASLKKQNEILRNHANSNVYRLLSGLVDFDGFYLESDPCLVCNNPEVPYSNNKLSAIKADARFSTTSHMVKLVGSHNISKVTLRVTDAKRQKMVKTINLYYNNRTVQSVVELKNKSALWQKAKKCHLIQGQTEVKIEFPLPIVACNLMIEYADFYENLQASSETLQCPRCSAPVPANPGVCGNCGENVYQCHKCRSINYDEKDPFLCNACGFCKYAKFDVTLTVKPCCAVDHIENEEDRKKAVSSINTLLERADKVYRQLVAHRQPLDSLLMKISEQGDSDFIKSEASHVSSGTGSGGSHAVNKSIQAVAHRYCVDCKGNFDELSRITQKVLASRKELIEYDSRVRDRATTKIPSRESNKSQRPPTKQMSTISDAQSVPGRCYGCSSAATEYCVTLLKALAMKPSTTDKLIQEGLIVELVNFTLYQGTSSIRNNVRDLLCLLTRNNLDAADQLNTILANRVTKGMEEQSVNPSVSSSLSRDMQLLTKTVELEDCCWEQRLRCVTQIFLLSVQRVSPVIVQAVTLPCLKILSQFVKPKPPTTKVNANKSVTEMASVNASAAPLAKMKDWIESKPEASYEEWERRAAMGPEASKSSSPEVIDESADDLNEEWLRNAMFSPSCGALRQVACGIVETVCQIPGRKRKIMDLLTSYLQGVGEAGENATEFFNLYSELIKSPPWKGYLASSGALLTIRDLIIKEIEQLAVLEETTLSSDLSQGYSLKRLTELMASFVEEKKIIQDFKGKLVGAVLNGYLSLRRLVVQRTKLVDQSQEILLNLLGELTSGTESETREFMTICVNTLNKYEEDDMRTPVFIFERLCNIIYPEENDVSEFLLMLEKDPQQEDFLQGRMQGNPYKSTDTGMGPLMRDVKNKICTDCDLIALLEDDTGMELLVNSKIISLDLPVKEVYKKIWCPQGEGEPMKVVYRMRGLLGDATEDIVEHLDKNNQKGVDNEIVYKMANVMNECGGLEAILKRLSGIQDLVRGRQLLEVIVKLLGFCVKVKANRDYLAKPSLKTLKILLDVLNQILHVEQATPGGVGTMAEQILSIIEALLQGGGANIKPIIAAGQKEEESQLEMLLEIIKTPYVRSNSNVLLSLMHILPFLTFGNKKSMNALIDHFEPYLDFEKFDKAHSDDELLFLECFCNIADGIENDENGNQLKNMIIDKGLVQQAVQYLEHYTPSQAFSTSNLSDTDLWKEFLARPSLPFILKFLSGMCKSHERSQLVVSRTAVPTIHRLEQVSSEEKVGSLAENLMEALKDHPDSKAKVTAVRRETRQEKKKLAMAMRLKQLGALGMSATESGKIITKPSAVIQGFEEISNETGLTCCICREGYKYHPNKVLGIYTYTKRCILDSFELKPRKTQGYSTVSHFNIVHYECHVAAIRLARGRDEWESAALQNSNTKCNGLLPIWGPQVPESSFASCLARHNNYIQEATSHIEPTFHNTVHDLRLLLERFAFEKSFNEDSGGGGRQSNFNIIPYMVHMALYVMNTARIRSLEKSVTTFIEEPHTSWIQSSYEVNGPLFVTVLSMFTHSLEDWKKTRLIFLNRLTVLAHVREVSPKGATKLSDCEVKPYNVYRSILIFFALVNRLQHMLKENVSSSSTWSQDVASYIRNNDEKVLKSCEELVSFYQDDLLPSSSFPEFCDVTGLLGEINEPSKYVDNLFNLLPK